jgi:thiamine-phosphate pyrophosphorylase
MPARWRHPSAILCLVTDRLALARHFAGARDPIELLTRQVAGAVDAGVDLVHLRERDLDAGALRDLTGACVSLAAGSDTRIVVNDRLDVALAANAHGVHLRGDSYSIADARGLTAPAFLVGRSIRAAGDAAASGDADYLVLGTIFPTPSKPGGGTGVGMEELQRAASAARVPVLAIGGVTEERLAEIGRTAAAGAAAIRLFFVLAVDSARDGRRRVQEWRKAFDTNRPIS